MMTLIDRLREAASNNTGITLDPGEVIALLVEIQQVAPQININFTRPPRDDDATD